MRRVNAVQLDPVATVTLSKSPADGGVQHLQLAQLQDPQPDTGPAAQQGSASAPTPAAAHQADAAGRKRCIGWPERYGCAPERESPPSSADYVGEANTFPGGAGYPPQTSFDRTAAAAYVNAQIATITSPPPH